MHKLLKLLHYRHILSDGVHNCFITLLTKYKHRLENEF
jgi:hypothetical protein